MKREMRTDTNSPARAQGSGSRFMTLFTFRNIWICSLPVDRTVTCCVVPVAESGFPSCQVLLAQVRPWAWPMVPGLPAAFRSGKGGERVFARARGAMIPPWRAARITSHSQGSSCPDPRFGKLLESLIRRGFPKHEPEQKSLPRMGSYSCRSPMARCCCGLQRSTSIPFHGGRIIANQGVAQKQLSVPRTQSPRVRTSRTPWNL